MEEEEETQNNNTQENRVKRYKNSSILPSQNALQDDTDWISRLPDSLLLHILSRLRIKEVAKTSILSKRWRYVWASLSCLDFTNLETGGKFEKTNFIGKFLLHHDESKVDKLCIEIEYKEKHALLVDSWIDFAIRHKVEKLELNLSDGESPEDLSLDFSLYKLPHSLFRCGSLIRLELRGCDLNLPATIQLNSLKTLNFQYIDLDPFAIEHITSHCPLLEVLYLMSCNKSIDLNICITNNNIKSLKIFEFEDYEFDNGVTTINAPNLIFLQFFDRLPRTNYHVEQLRSLVNVDFYSVYGDISDDQDVLQGKYTGCDFAQLLQDLCYVKEFRLNSWCIQALTAKEIRGLDRVTINATCIKLSLGLTKWELPGIAYLLHSASYLETLEIHCCCLPNSKLSEEFLEEYDFEEKEFWKVFELDSSSILQNTKTITIGGFHSTHLVEDLEHWEMDLDHSESEIELVRFLLKTSKVLERMTIRLCISSRNNIEIVLFVKTMLYTMSEQFSVSNWFYSSYQGSPFV